MKKILGLLLAASAWAVSSGDTVNYGKYFVGRNPDSVNYIKNPSCFTNTIGVTGTNNTPSRNTTTPLTSIADCQSTLDSSSDTIDLTTNTLDRSLKNGNCEASIRYKLTLGSGNTIQLQARINSATVSSVDLTTADNGLATINFPCGDLSNAPSLRIAQTAGSSSQAINWSNAYLGAARNVGTVAQAQFIGSATIANTGCNWQRNNTTLGLPGTDTDCTGPSVEFNPGPGTIQTTDTDLPQFTVNGLAPGYYEVTMEFDARTTVGSGGMQAAINDGTTTSGIFNAGNNNASTNESHWARVVSYFNYTTSGNKTFSLYMASNSNAMSINADSSTRPLRFYIKRFPSSSEIAVRPNQAGASYSGTMVGAGGGWSTTSSSYADPSVATTSSTLTQIAANNLSCVAESTKLPAITCTFNMAGNYLVMASPSIKNASTSSALARLVNGSTIIDGGVISSGATTGGAVPTKLAGIVNVAAAGSQTFKIQLMTSNASNATSINQQTESPITWTVIQVDYGMQTPILVGSVTSGSTGATRLEWVNVFTQCTSTPCTITAKSSDAITSVTRATNGDYTVVFPSGTWSTPPSCTVFALNTTSRVAQRALADPTTTAFRFATTDGTFSLADSSFTVQCMGNR